ncbi:MAG TPA: dipeptidase [Thermoanaerobaculia bacterium]|jgi:acetylornithine deacetylase/succinyl-diaminopimelate desuccinylase-like protein|nr:dipeptidase [Thermoanaerobaculia bacterium]
MGSDSRDVLARIDKEQEGYLEELKDYIRIPSISTDPDYKADVLRAAEFLLGKMREAGLQAERIDTAGHPLVYGEWLGAPGKPTVLFYGHYDVQPVDPIELWRNPPFEPAVEGDKLVARGATDDKGQSYTHVKGVGAMLAERGKLPVNVKFLVEGEEEAGGQAIDEYVRRDGGKRLAADCVVISDTSLYAPGQPSLIYGLKGLCYMELKVTGPNRDLHSGTFGGAVWNPLNALCHIIDRLRDAKTGKVLIPGFYDDVRPLAAWEREEFAKLPFDEDAYREELGVKALFGEEGYTTRERTWARPTCDVNGIFGGYMGKGAKTVLPSWGGAKVSMRLVPDQEPKKIAEMFTAYVQSIAPQGVTVEVTTLHGADPVVVETEGPIVDAAMDAMEEVWGARPVRVREGGSIPIVSTFASVLKCPVLLLGFGLHDDGLHSPNEKFNISHFYKGIRSVARLLDRLGDL